MAAQSRFRNGLRNPWVVRLTALVCMVSAALPYVSSPDTWKGTHWLFRLDDGVLRRAIAGSLLGWWQAGSPVSLHTITVVSVIACALFAITFSFVIALYLRTPLPDSAFRTPRWWAGGLALVYFATAPGGLRQYLADMGRFDVLGALAIVLGLLLTHQ